MTQGQRSNVLVLALNSNADQWGDGIAVLDTSQLAAVCIFRGWKSDIKCKG